MKGLERLREVAKGTRSGVNLFEITNRVYDGEHGLSFGDQGPALKILLGDIADQIKQEQERESAELFNSRVVDEANACKALGLDPGDDPLTALRRHIEAMAKTNAELSGVCDEYWVTLMRVCDRIGVHGFMMGGRRDEIIGALDRRLAAADESDELRENLKDACEARDALRVGLCSLLGGDLNEMLDKDRERLLEIVGRRLMPEGCEWPRFEDGAPVAFRDKGLDVHGHTRSVEGVKITQGGFVFISDDMGRAWWANDQGPTEDPCVDPAKRVKRPAKVLDADGVEIRVGDILYYPETGASATVSSIFNGNVYVLFPDGEETTIPPASYSHRAPVLAADGKPLRVGETVYGTGRTQHEFKVRALNDPNPEVGNRFSVRCFDMDEGDECWCDPRLLTHKRHETDSWERLEEDALGITYDIGKNLGDYSPSDFKETGDSVQDRVMDLVRRAKALAGVSE